MKEKILIRPKEGRMLFGVCQGFANYFEIDPTIVRLIFVVLAFWGGAGIIAYLICLFLMPEDNTAQKESKKEDKVKDRVEQVASEVRTRFADEKGFSKYFGWQEIVGVVILILGLILFFQIMFSWINFWKLWPLIFILVGIILIIRGSERSK